MGWAARASEVRTAEGAAGVVGQGKSTGALGGPAPIRKLEREADLGDPAPYPPGPSARPQALWARRERASHRPLHPKIKPGCRPLSQSERRRASLGQWPPRMLMSVDARGRPIQRVAAIVGVGRAPPGPLSDCAGTEPGRLEAECCGRAPMAGAAMAEPGGGPPPAPGTEGLPRAFLQSLRTLFDILDDRRRGLVHLREIESRWRGADARELPRGVLEGLRQVAPASGYLTFERFVAGLRTALPSADGGTRGPARDPAREGCSARPGGQPPPSRLVFAPADEPRTVLERKPLPLGARPAPAAPGVASRNLEKPCGPAEAAAGPAEPERPRGAALERSPSKDTGECGAAPGPARSSPLASPRCLQGKEVPPRFGCSGTLPRSCLEPPQTPSGAHSELNPSGEPFWSEGSPPQYLPTPGDTRALGFIW